MPRTKGSGDLKRCAATVVSLTLLALPATARSSLPPRPSWLPVVWYAIGKCETGLNWRHATRDYVTAFGIYRPSWAAFSPLDPEQATPRQQLAVAQRIARRFGLNAWGCYRHGGYRYWLA